MQMSHNEVIDMKDVHIKNTPQRESWLGRFFKVLWRMFPRIEEPANQGPDAGRESGMDDLLTLRCTSASQPYHALP